MRDLFLSQGARCAYSGEALVPGVNASVDHRQPVSRGGVHALENLQWVSRKVNIMKSDMTHEEFLDTCHAIVTLERPLTHRGSARSS